MTPAPPGIRNHLEHHQTAVYFAAVVAGVLVAAAVPAASALEAAISPALALMLFVTFLQVPLADLGRAATNVRFLAPLLVANFVAVPLLVLVLLPILPDDPMLTLGVLLVLLTPCIDYVVTFSQLGNADSRSLLASTPVLLLAQMALLPLYLTAFRGDEVSDLVQAAPFVDAFVWLIAMPLAMAAIVQVWARRHEPGRRLAARLSLLPVPATAAVLFIVVAAVLPQVGTAASAALAVLPVYVAFAVLAPIVGWLVARTARLDEGGRRAVAFSTGTRNSLVVLPLAFAVPGAIPVLPAVIVTQTLVELIAEIAYVRLIGRAGAGAGRPGQGGAKPG